MMGTRNFKGIKISYKYIYVLVINTCKTKILVFNKKEEKKNGNEGSELEDVQVFKYLGFIVIVKRIIRFTWKSWVKKYDSCEQNMRSEGENLQREF